MIEALTYDRKENGFLDRWRSSVRVSRRCESVQCLRLLRVCVCVGEVGWLMRWVPLSLVTACISIPVTSAAPSCLQRGFEVPTPFTYGIRFTSTKIQ
jgi:hypothetical protein